MSTKPKAPKSITPESRLAAFALFILSAQHYAKCREFEEALARQLGFEDDGGNFGMGDLSDRIYCQETSVGAFDAALKKDGVVVVKKAKLKRRGAHSKTGREP